MGLEFYQEQTLRGVSNAHGEGVDVSKILAIPCVIGVAISTALGLRLQER